MFCYYTVKTKVQVKIAVGACRFYASIAPVENESEVKTYLKAVEEQLPGATHYANAFRLGFGDEMLARSDDDGEPAGTAGTPLLAVLEKAEVTNVMLVGTRFFGGVKLGIGGLIRAYRACGEAGVKAATIVKEELKVKMKLLVPYGYLGAVEREIKALEGEVLQHSFGEHVSLNIILPLRRINGFDERIAGISRGEVVIKAKGIFKPYQESLSAK